MDTWQTFQSVAADAGAVLEQHSTLTMWIGPAIVALVITLVHFRRVYRRRDGSPRSWRQVLAMTFPRRWLLRKSHLLDIWMSVMNQKVTGLLIGWMIISYHFVSVETNSGLTRILGALPATPLDPWVVTAIMTVVLYLAYEFAYWLDHYVSHAVPFLWEFHKVHHEAEVLSPLTNSRVHPIDSLVFANITVLIVGAVNGAMTYLFGQDARALVVFDTNVILVVFSFFIVQLQHSEVWLPLTGIWGKLLASPAHHQIHHSTNPAHFNKNLGSCLVIFDWMFGTLHVPARERERLTFGVDEQRDVDHHSLEHGLITPFRRAFTNLKGLIPAAKTPAQVPALGKLQAAE